MSRSKRPRRRPPSSKPKTKPQASAGSRADGGVLGFALLLVAAVIVYANSFSNPFVFDDLPRIVDNPFIRRLWPPTDVLAHTSRPLVQLTLAMNHAVSGLDVWSYHAFNLAAHVLSGWGMLWLVRYTLSLASMPHHIRRAAAGLSCVAALLWIVHPIQTQAVTYVIQRGEVLGSLLYLATLILAIRAWDASRSRSWQVAAILCCAAGLTAKPMVATAPLMVVAYDRVFLAGSWRALWARRAPLYAGLFASLALLPWLLARAPMDWRHSAGLTTPGVSPAEYAATQPGIVLHYLKQAWWPHPLVFDYMWPVANGAAAIAVPAAVVAVLLGGSVLLLARGVRLGFLGLWFFVILAPTSSVVPVLDLAVEHRLYLALAAITVLATLAGFEVMRRLNASRAVSIAIVSVVVVTLGALTVRRNRDYASPQALWSDTVSKRPANLRARVNLGFTLDQAGAREQALEHFRAVVEQDPEYAWARVAAGQTLEKLGRRDESLVHLREAVRLMPASAEARYQLGTVLLRARHSEAAVEHLSEAARLEPGRGAAFNNLGAAYEQLQDDSAAADAFAAAIRLDPRSAMLRCNLGYALGRLGRLQESRQQFLAALQLEPTNRRATEALAELDRAMQP